MIATTITSILHLINLTVDDKSGEVTGIAANNIAVDRNDVAMTSNAQIASLVANYKALATPIANRVIGQVTYGEAFTVQPFGNSLVTLTLTGEQIHIMLEQQFTGCHAGNAPASWGYPASDTVGQSFNHILQVSNGFSYRWSASGPACDKVDL